MRKSHIALFLHAGASVILCAPAQASFHLIQIEQVVGGVNGNTTAQAVQLRLRDFGENFVSQGSVLVRDAAGANPVLLLDLTSDVLNGKGGDRVLLITPSFASHLSPTTTPDFVLANPIPASYLAAGSLTWEDDFGSVIWRLCWGGAAYTGPTNMSFLNGNCPPPFAGPLPSSSLQALQFQGPFDAQSTANATDYLVTTGAALFTNNAGESGVVIAPQPCPANIVTTGASATRVDVDDLLAVISGWGPCPAPPAACPANIVTAGASATRVDVDDLLAVISGWGPCP